MQWNTIHSEDERYLEGIFQSNSEVLRELYREWRPGIIRHVQTKGGNAQDADDVFQDAMVVLYRKIKTGKLTLTSRLSTYFYGIAKKVWLKKRTRRLRKQSPTEPSREYATEDNVEALLEKTERYRFFREKLRALGSDCRQILEMFITGESMEKIARAMGFASAGYAKKRKFYCKQKLIRLIREDGRFEEFTGQ